MLSLKQLLLYSSKELYCSLLTTHYREERKTNQQEQNPSGPIAFTHVSLKYFINMGHIYVFVAGN
jgi:hypothetical protein